MTRYFCHNCNDKYLKTITAVINHVWSEHGVILEKMRQPVMRSEDARLPLKKTGSQRVSAFRCEDCKVSLTSIHSFLVHLDRMHGIHLWYEKGLTRKRVFFDGILEGTSEDRTGQEKLFPISKKNIPLSKRPYEPRKK